jgi:DNA-binding NtrC family response regulator
MPQALVVEDDSGHRGALTELIETEGFEVAAVGTLADARRELSQRSFDLLFVDLRLPDGSALELLPEIERSPGMDAVLVTGHATVDSAVEAFRRGAFDYLTKPVDLPRLREILAHARRAARLRDEVGALRRELRELGRFGKLVGASAAMQKVYDQIQKVAPTDATVLITGETGTGKELVAETLHALSRRREAPFLPLNCGAVSATLIESELFGHERGSFTGATARRDGYFERANSGTLFLDEISEMPVELQVKLLRAIETQDIQRIGADQPIRVDVRVVAATNRDPELAVAEGRLREDLLYRLNVFPIQVPPLRERGEDVDLLATNFLARLNQRAGTRKELSRAARERLRAHAWPGNVRELKHVIERAFISGGDEIEAEWLGLGEPPAGPAVDAAAAAAAGELPIRVGMSAAEAERVLTLATLERYGERRRAAEVLGISLKTLYNRLKSYQGQDPAPEPGED